MDGSVTRHRIWVVEDDIDVREAMRNLLYMSGFDVEDFPHGAAAWFALEGTRHPPDAILLDLHMPYMDGLEFRRRQLAAHAVADIPVIVFTANFPVMVPGALVMPKPVQPELLISALETACLDRQRSLTTREPRREPRVEARSAMLDETARH